MPFINGFRTEEDIKIKLYYPEPEQISDLVYCPLPGFILTYLGDLMLNPDRDIYQEVESCFNLPFSVKLQAINF